MPHRASVHEPSRRRRLGATWRSRLLLRAFVALDAKRRGLGACGPPLRARAQTRAVTSRTVLSRWAHEPCPWPPVFVRGHPWPAKRWSPSTRSQTRTRFPSGASTSKHFVERVVEDERTPCVTLSQAFGVSLEWTVAAAGRWPACLRVVRDGALVLLPEEAALAARARMAEANAREAAAQARVRELEALLAQGAAKG